MLKLILALSTLIATTALAADAPKAPATGLDQSVIDSTVKKGIHKIKACYEDNTKGLEPLPQGIVTTRFTIGADGKVTAVEIVGSDLNNSKVESCLQTELKNLVFPAPAGNGAVRVDYPFRFAPSTKKKKSAS